MAEMPTSPKITHPKKRAFLAAYRQSGNIRASTEAAGIERKHFYWWCEHDLVFAAAACQAKEEFGDLLEAKLAQLALRQDNVTALIVGLKMMGRFVERTRSEQTVEVSGHLDVDTRESLAGRIAELGTRLSAAGIPGEPE